MSPTAFSCEAFDSYPPGFLERLPCLNVSLPGGTFLTAQLLRPRFLRDLPTTFGGLSRKRVPNAQLLSWVEPLRRDRTVRRDLAHVELAPGQRVRDGVVVPVDLDVVVDVHPDLLPLGEHVARMLHEGLGSIFWRVVWLSSERFREVGRRLVARRVGLERRRRMFQCCSSRAGGAKRTGSWTNVRDAITVTNGTSGRRHLMRSRNILHDGKI